MPASMVIDLLSVHKVMVELEAEEYKKMEQQSKNKMR
jgi:hypothetical protein